MFRLGITQISLAAIQTTQTVENQSTGNNQMDNWITIFGIIVTWLIAVIGFAITYHQSKQNGITKPRIEWINHIRNITADVVRYDYNHVTDEAKLSEINGQLMRNAYLLSLHLNVVGPFDGVIFDYLVEAVKARTQTVTSLPNEKFQYARRKLNFAMQIYLKAEWERVKWENKLLKIGRYTCEKEKKEIEKLLKAFTEEDYIVKEILQKYKENLSTQKPNPRVFTEFVEVRPKPQ